MRIFAFFFAGLLLLSACGTDPLAGDTDVSTVLEHALAESEFSAIRSMFDLEAQADSLIRKTSSSNGIYCPCSTTNAVDNGDGTYLLVLDFGTGCQCLDGRTRSGKLIGSFSGKWSQSGTRLVIQPDNYQVTALNGVKYDIDFIATIVQAGLSNAGNPEVSIEVKDAVIHSQQKGTMTWEDSRIIEWIEGIMDGDPMTNVYRITGNASGVTTTSVSFTARTSIPLIARADCPHIVEGELILSPEAALNRKINYGDGTCDNKAEVSIGPFSTTITLY